MGASWDVLAWAASGAGAAPPVIGVLTLWLRYRERRDRAERLLHAARELPPGSEVAERFGDGGSLYVRTGPSAGKAGRRAGA